MALDPLSQQTVDLLAGAVTAKQNIITALRNKEAVVPDNARLADLPPIIDGIETEPDDIRQFMIEKSIEQSHGGGLIAGDLNCGYCGSVLGADMGTFDNGPAAGYNVTASSLAVATGVTEGTAFNATITFDKFVFNNEVLLVPRKPIRYAVSWKELALNNCVFGGKVLSIGGVKYKMTLLRGSNAEITDGARFDTDSEWGQLILPLLAGHADGWGTDLSANDLNFADSGDGSRNWCQETTSIDSGENRRLIIRGSGGSSAGSYYVGSAYSYCGWRPALRFTL